VLLSFEWLMGVMGDGVASAAEVGEEVASVSSTNRTSGWALRRVDRDYCSGLTAGSPSILPASL
jgi:hypothetical protein